MAAEAWTTLLLDSGVIGRLCHNARSVSQPARALMHDLLSRPEFRLFLPEIIDYEVRRKLLHLASVGRASRRSLDHLDGLSRLLIYLPLDTATMRRAAELWADARALGLPTAADAALDIDVILAVQALSVGGTVVTTNTRHLSRFVTAKTWEELS